MRSFFLRCILIFFITFCGMSALIIVDSISGTMIGYEPMLGVTINEIGYKSLEATAFGQKIYLDLNTL